MIVHVGTEVNIVFGVVKDGNIIEKIPCRIEMTEISNDTLLQLESAFKKLKEDLENKVK